MALNAAFRWFIRKRMMNIEQVRSRPVELQRHLFNRLLFEGRGTEFGVKHGFNSVRSLREFQKQVPIRTYDQFKPFIERAQEGKRSVLWPGETRWFAKSSGTSSDRSKFLPVTEASLHGCHFKGGKDLLALYCEQRPHAELYDGRHLILGGASALHENGLGGFSGDLSAIIVRNLPFWVEARRTPSREIALMENWEKKVDALAHGTLHEDVRILAGVPSWMLVVAKRVLELSQAKSLGEVWPNLQLYMHGGVSFEPYRSEFDALVGGTRLSFDCLETYNASEGFFGLQDRLDGDDLLMMLDYGIYFEFLPMSEWDVENPQALELRELEVGKEYALVITTNAGLWRYALGDVVRITHVHPFRMQVVGRTASYLNAFGEEVMVDQAERAIAEASTLADAHVRDYTAAPVFMNLEETGAHEWCIEFSKPPAGGMALFMECLDASLRRQNSDYDAKRTAQLALRFPIGCAVAVGTFDGWLQSKGKLGGQHKVPRLANDRSIVEALMDMQIKFGKPQLAQ